MKQFIAIIALATMSFIAQAQTKTTKQINPGQTKPAPNLNANEIKNMTTGLPDLKFTSITVTAAPNTAEGADYYALTITYTIKNEGKVAVLCDNIHIQGYTTNEYWVSKQAFDPALTGVFHSACGHILSRVFDKGETLDPGQSIQRSYLCSSQHLPRNPKPVYIITINQYNPINESDYSNNTTQTTIPL